jgi:3-dehydroquinate synthase class II
MYVIHKQLIPNNNLIWVLKINDSDVIHSFSTIEEAEIKLNELKHSDTDGRGYKISLQKEDGSFSDL